MNDFYAEFNLNRLFNPQNIVPGQGGTAGRFVGVSLQLNSCSADRDILSGKLSLPALIFLCKHTHYTHDFKTNATNIRPANSRQPNTVCTEQQKTKNKKKTKNSKYQTTMTGA